MRICKNYYGPVGYDPNIIDPNDVSHVTVCNGDIVTTWGGYANLDERTESAEAFIYKESHPLTRGKYQRGRDRQRLWARLELTEAELEGATPSDPERAALIRNVLTTRRRFVDARGRSKGRIATAQSEF